eukprot:6208852-Pleurochrysis_carterae.AAC.2
MFRTRTFGLLLHATGSKLYLNARRKKQISKASMPEHQLGECDVLKWFTGQSPPAAVACAYTCYIVLSRGLAL